MKQYIVGPYQEYVGQVIDKPSIAPVLLNENGEDRHEWWAPIEGYPEYEVSTRGRVVSKRFRKRKVLKQTTNNTDGYWQVNLWHKKTCHTLKVHRLVAYAFKGPRPEGFQIDHIDGDKLNNDAGNLQYISGTNNTRKARSKCPVFTYGSNPKTRTEGDQLRNLFTDSYDF